MLASRASASKKRAFLVTKKSTQVYDISTIVSTPSDPSVRRRSPVADVALPWSALKTGPIEGCPEQGQQSLFRYISDEKGAIVGGFWNDKHHVKGPHHGETDRVSSHGDRYFFRESRGTAVAENS